jgi:hypothetical protein
MTNRNREFHQNNAHMLIGALRQTYGPSFAKGCADNESAIRSVSLPAEGTYLVKLGKREHMLDFYKRGRLRIAPASSYADPSLNCAVRDDELSLSAYGLQSEVLIEVFDQKTGKLKAATNPIGNLTYTSRSHTDYYVYCMGVSLDHRLFGDFGYNACVIVRDRGTFMDRLSKAVEKRLPGWIGAASAVQYIDPFLQEE